MVSKKDERIKVIIVGAGKAGELLTGDILRHNDSGLHIVGFVDDDKTKQCKTIEGVRVIGTISDLPRLVKKGCIKELIIAIPSKRGVAIRQIIDRTEGLGLEYKILPGLAEILIQDFDKDYLKYVRSVRVEDLLGGEILKSDQADISKFAEGQTIMITGAAGSIGSELSRQIVAYGAKTIVLYDWWENGMFELRNQLVEDYPDSDIEYIIGDVKDSNKLSQVMSLYKPTTLFHAAAYKHVPLMESNPSEAIKNNIIGTKIVAEAAIKFGVKKFIMISTDKAVNPTNIMGATKRAAEKVIHILSQCQSVTTFCAVRFGNVINSNGSAIPFFEKQIEKGGPVTVTHKEVTRFFMTIPEAVHLILQSWVMGQSNDLFVLDMGEPVKIYDLAKLLISIHGYIPNKEIMIKIVGLRPGEKLYEEVLVEQEETQSTPFKKIFKTKNYHNFNKTVFLYNLDVLQDYIKYDGLKIDFIKKKMQELVSTYKPANH